jgi:hypothetical protein
MDGIVRRTAVERQAGGLRVPGSLYAEMRCRVCCITTVGSLHLADLTLMELAA